MTVSCTFLSFLFLETGLLCIALVILDLGQVGLEPRDLSRKC